MKVAIVGHGKQGARHARVAQSLGHDVVTVDPDAPANCRSLQDAPHCEIVVVAVSHAHLHAMAAEALLGGSHVLVEKPGGLTAFDARSLAQHADAMGLVFQIGYCERFNPAAVCLKDALPTIGDVVSIEARRFGPEPEISAGAAHDLLAHDLDLLAYLGLDWSTASGSARHGHAQADLVGEGTFRLEAGYGDRQRHWTITGAHGCLNVDWVSRSVWADDRLPVADGEPLLHQFQHFVGVIDGTHPPVDPAGAIRALEVIEEISRSSLRCGDCHRHTTKTEAAQRVFNTGDCVCGGTLTRSA